MIPWPNSDKTFSSGDDTLKVNRSQVTTKSSLQRIILLSSGPIPTDRDYTTHLSLLSTGSYWSQEGNDRLDQFRYAFRTVRQSFQRLPLGANSSSQDEADHWEEMRRSLNTQVCRWHTLIES